MKGENMAIRWNYSDTWAKGIFTLKNQAPEINKRNAVDSTLRGILSLNPFGTTVKMPKKLASDEFMTFKYPKMNLIDNILKNL